MAFLGIQIAPNISNLLSKIDVPGDKIPTSEMHITMLYFGETWPISEISKIIEPAFDIISTTPPFTIKTNKVTHFPINPHDKDKYPVITRVESKELHDLREKLAKKLDQEEIQYSKLHPEYKPHITLSYSEDKPKDIICDPLQFTVSEIVLWCGDHGNDRIFITFPLAGPEITKHSFLLQKAFVFEKLANNLLPNIFTTTLKR